MQSSPFASKYSQSIDRESAYEKLAAKVLEDNRLAQEAIATAQREKEAKEAIKAQAATKKLIGVLLGVHENSRRKSNRCVY